MSTLSRPGSFNTLPRIVSGTAPLGPLLTVYSILSVHSLWSVLLVASQSLPVRGEIKVGDELVATRWFWLRT